MSIIQNVKKTINYSRKNGYREAACAAWERATARYYKGYNYVAPEASVLEEQRQDKNVSTHKISLVVPAYETKELYMTALIDCCLAQTYANWELIIADGSESDIVKTTIDQYDDERIRYVKLADNGGISDNTNQAIMMATGEYCGLLDHDDILTQDALYEIVKAIAESEKTGHRPILIYSDEDKCDSEGKTFYDPHVKLDFNFDLILTNNYICHFMVLKTVELQKLQLRKQYDGAQDFDLVLRIVSNLFLREKQGTQDKVEDYILHVPKIIYHWRCHPESTADNPLSKMYAYEAGRKALADFTHRVGWKADIRHNKHLGFYRIAYRNDVLHHRDDLAAAGGLVAHRGKITSGIYRGQPLIYAGYMNRMDLYQNVRYVDIRNLAVNKKYWSVYEDVTGHEYVDTFVYDGFMLDAGSEHQPNGCKLPEWMEQLSGEELDRINRKLSKQLLSDGARLLLDPESIRKV